jgi:flagellar hook assembly protein FlgD
LESSSFEESEFVTFSHLPEKVNVKIYSLAGSLVRTLEKNSTTPFLNWDLKNEFDLKVASGLYIVHIDATDLGEEKILKLAVIQSEFRIDSY